MSTPYLSTFAHDRVLGDRSLTDHIQVLRWSALVVGIFYGFSHQRTVTARSQEAHVQKEWKNKEDLIQKAKLEWKKKQNPQPFTKSGDGMLK